METPTGTKNWLSRVGDFAKKTVFRIVGYLWAFAALVVYYGLTATPDRYPESPGFFGMFLFPYSFDEMVGWSVLVFVFSAMFAIWRWRKWRGERWLSLLTWSSMAGAFAAWSTTLGWMPRARNFIDVYEMIGTWYVTFATWPADLFDLGVWIPIAMFLVVLGLHTSGDDGSAIGGRWKPLWAGVLGVVVFVLMTRYNPIFLYSELSIDFSLSASEPTFIDEIKDFVIAWAGIVLPMVSACAVMAWKTRASLFVNDDKMTIGLGEGLGLFRVRWKRVLSTTEVFLKGERRSVIIEHGVLPWYRMRFGFHKRRDGAKALDEVLQHIPNKRRTDLRRGTKLAGYLSLLIAAACVALVQWKMFTSMGLMSDAHGDFAKAFVGQDHFLLFGWLMIGAGCFLGLGLGMLFASNYAGVRVLPFLGVAFCASLLPSAVIYWLVYIALYAIITAQLQPIEMIPHVPFPDHRIAEFGLWASDAKALFALLGYVVGTMIALRPWTRFMPGWPYGWPLSARGTKEADSDGDAGHTTVASA